MICVRYHPMTAIDISEKKEENYKPLFSIESLIVSKNPRLLKFIPNVVLNYFKGVIHEEELNDAMHRFRHLPALEFIDSILGEFGSVIVVKGDENIPTTGRLMVASNHPLGGMDGMALMKAVGRVRHDFTFPVNDLLMHVPNLKPHFIPINKHGSNAGNIRIMDEAYASDQTVLYFPAGMCSRMTKGQILDLEWKKTFLTKARKFQRDIIPTYIDGRNSLFFYRLANIRKFLGIKANVEMLYLVDEMYKQRGRTLTILFGKPIPYTTFDKRHTDQEWAARIKAHVYALKDGKDNFNDFI